MRILITGATGMIGSYLTPYLANDHHVIATSRSAEELDAYKNQSNIETAQLDVSDMDACQRIIRDVDVVIHLAVAPLGSSWDDTLQANLIGLYNVIESARASGVKRFIFTSSIHAVDEYPPDKQVEVTDLPHPSDLYGVSKVFGETLCSYYAHQKGLESIAIRIAAFNGLTAEDGEVNVNPRGLATYFHQDDLGPMIDHCLSLEMKEPYYVLHGSSDNQFKRLSMTMTKKILEGYAPSYDAFEELDVEIEKTVDEEAIDDEVIDPD